MHLPNGIAALYEILLDQTTAPSVLCTPESKPWRRSNFRCRFWRPAWDGRNPDDPNAGDHVPAILPWFTFHEGRHTHSTWLAEDGIPEITRRARLGQKMKGIARVYNHVTPAMRQDALNVLEARWLGSLAALSPAQQSVLVGWFPHLRPTLNDLPATSSRKLIATFPPHTA